METIITIVVIVILVIIYVVIGGFISIFTIPGSIANKKEQILAAIQVYSVILLWPLVLLFLFGIYPFFQRKTK
jgi:hypothetical protein